LKYAPSPSFAHYHIGGTFGTQCFKQRHGIDKLALAVEFLRVLSREIVLDDGFWCRVALRCATGGNNHCQKPKRKQLHQVTKWATHDSISCSASSDTTEPKRFPEIMTQIRSGRM
jgi:hypothetical protein